MIAYLLRLFRRLLAFRNITLEGRNALVLIDGHVELRFARGSNLIVRNGALRIGYDLPGTVPYSSFPRTVVQLDEGAEWLCDGPVVIAPGSTIRVCKKGQLHLEGENRFAHNLTLLCKNKIHIMRSASFSWNITMIDDDGHRFSDASGNALRKFVRPLVIGKNAGLQMGVTIPSAVTIGDRAVVAAGTVLRQDVPSDCTAYTEQSLKIRSGWMMPPDHGYLEKNPTKVSNG